MSDGQDLTESLEDRTGLYQGTTLVVPDEAS
jgi:hypothetical protein